MMKENQMIKERKIREISLFLRDYILVLYYIKIQIA